MNREMIWVEKDRFHGWGCSQCAWLFNPVGLPTGRSLNEMIRNYEEQRDKEFAAHICAKYPRVKKTNN
ncbi:MAG TPA: hypothetical protein VGZ48_14620 [Candidatus Acidoferrales bacterium]|jgi:hypothetical protein|nr:hypothetical protein [Candidatus Acidoferrales bacterium]